MFYKDYQRTIWVHAIFWIFGFTTVRFWKKVEPWGPTRIYYPTVLLLVCIGSRIERIIEDDNFLTPSLELYVYLSMKTLETLAPICILICEIFFNKELKVQAYKNLKYIDEKLKIDCSKYRSECMKVERLLLVYMLATLAYYTGELYIWKKGVHQLFLSLKLIITDLVILEYGQDVNYNAVRLKSLNKYIEKKCILGTPRNQQVDFEETTMIKTSNCQVEGTIEFISILEIYDKLRDNARNMGRRISLHVLVVSLMAVLVIMTTANMLSSPNKYSQINYLSAFISMFLWQSRYVMYFIWATIFTEKLVQGTYNTRRLLGKICAYNSPGKKMSADLKNLIWITSRNDLRVHVWRLFPLDLTLFYGFIALAATYSIILIQMTSS